MAAPPGRRLEDAAHAVEGLAKAESKIQRSKPCWLILRGFIRLYWDYYIIFRKTGINHVYDSTERFYWDVLGYCSFDMIILGLPLDFIHVSADGHPNA